MVGKSVEHGGNEHVADEIKVNPHGELHEEGGKRETIQALSALEPSGRPSDQTRWVVALASLKKRSSCSRSTGFVK